MALIKCPECGKEISDKSQACIHCGYPLYKETPKEESPNDVVLSRSQASIIPYIFGETIVDLIIGFGCYFLITKAVKNNPALIGLIIFIAVVIKCIAITALVEGIIDVTRNNKRLDKNIIEYNQENNTFILTGIFGHPIELEVDKFLFFDGNKRIYAYFYSDNGKKKNRYLGYSDVVKAEQARQKIKMIKESQ